RSGPKRRRFRPADGILLARAAKASERPSTAPHPSRNSGPLHGSRSSGFARGFLPGWNRLLRYFSGKASRNPAPSADQKRSSWSWGRHGTAPEAACLQAMAQAAGPPPARQCCSCAYGTPWAENRAPLPPAGQSLPVSSFHLRTVSAWDSAPGFALIRGQFLFKPASISVHLSRPRHLPWVPWICGECLAFLRVSASPWWVFCFNFQSSVFWEFVWFALIRGHFSSNLLSSAPPRLRGGFLLSMSAIPYATRLDIFLRLLEPALRSAFFIATGLVVARLAALLRLPPAFAVAFFFTDADLSSNSHSAPFRTGALRLLSHSADFSSPPISARLRPVRTEQSSASMSKPGCVASSLFFISSHSVPFDPGRRERMCASTNSPLSFLPCRRNLRSPLLSMAFASPKGSHFPTSHTITVPAP